MCWKETTEMLKFNIVEIFNKKCAEIEILSTDNLRLTPRNWAEVRLCSHRQPNFNTEHK